MSPLASFKICRHPESSFDGSFNLPSTFYAIPLPKQGESFLLRTAHNGEDVNIIVDAGWGDQFPLSRGALTSFLTNNVPDIKVIHRFVITHEDGDHCQGASQFIEDWLSSGGSIEQVWLPAHWSITAGAPLDRGYERSEIIYKEALRAAPKILEKLRQLTERTRGADEEGQRLQDGQNDLGANMLVEAVVLAANEDGGLDDLYQEKSDDASANCIDDLLRRLPEPWLRRSRYHPQTDVLEIRREVEEEALSMARQQRREWGQVDRLATYLTMAVIDTHEKMAPTIAACIHHGIMIRWFDFKAFANHKPNPAPSGGDPGVLVPVNAREVQPSSKPLSITSVFYALALTVANRESLVFYRPEDPDKEPPVLFTADSRLKLRHTAYPAPAGLSGRQRLLATAPHHASSNNHQAYAVMKVWLPPTSYPPIFVRNGGWKVSAVAADFRAAVGRQCVRCVPSPDQASLVRFEALAGGWQDLAHPKPCSC